MPVSSHVPQPSNQRQKTRIFIDDENNDQCLRQGAVNSNISARLEHSRSAQENLKKPGPWNKVKVKVSSVSGSHGTQNKANYTKRNWDFLFGQSKVVPSSYGGASQGCHGNNQSTVKVFEEEVDQVAPA